MTQTNTLKKKIVICVENGKLLGKIKDFYIDDTGKVCCFTVEKKDSLFSQKEKRESYTVSWNDITAESADVILVKAYRDGEIDTSKKRDGIFSGIQGYIAAALLIASLLILLKSCIG